MISISWFSCSEVIGRTEIVKDWQVKQTQHNRVCYNCNIAVVDIPMEGTCSQLIGQKEYGLWLANRHHEVSNKTKWINDPDDVECSFKFLSHSDTLPHVLPPDDVSLQEVMFGFKQDVNHHRYVTKHW